MRINLTSASGIMLLVSQCSPRVLLITHTRSLISKASINHTDAACKFGDLIRVGWIALSLFAPLSDKIFETASFSKFRPEFEFPLPFSDVREMEGSTEETMGLLAGGDGVQMDTCDDGSAEMVGSNNRFQ